MNITRKQVKKWRICQSMVTERFRCLFGCAKSRSQSVGSLSLVWHWPGALLAAGVSVPQPAIKPMSSALEGGFFFVFQFKFNFMYFKNETKMNIFNDRGYSSQRRWHEPLDTLKEAKIHCISGGYSG